MDNTIKVVCHYNTLRMLGIIIVLRSNFIHVHFYLCILSSLCITASRMEAVCNLVEANGSGTTGVFYLHQRRSHHLTIHGNITNLAAGRHGFHVHTIGSTDNDCKNAGPHFHKGVS